MVFYKPDGAYATHLTGRLINERSFCGAMAKAMPGGLSKISIQARNFQKGLTALENLVRDQYSVDARLSSAKRANKGKSSVSGVQKQLQAKSDDLSVKIREKRMELGLIKEEGNNDDSKGSEATSQD